MAENLQFLISIVAVAITVLSVVGAFRAGVLKKLRIGSLEVEATPEEREKARDLVRSVSEAEGALPFETEQLALYYGQVLSQSKISFWFSLVFASLGFLLLVSAIFMYSSDALGTTVAQFVAGSIMDAVAALFFVQSRNAQTSMGEFFDKLRRDRDQLESRRLCNDVEDARGRDALRIQLALHYADVPEATSVASSIISSSVARYRDDG